LSRVCRDLLVLAIDSSRFDDAEVAPEGDRDRLRTLVPRFSREDLMRAFDVLSRAEVDIRNASQPRYHLEMALLRWVHLRHLVPLADLIDGLESGVPVERAGGGPVAPPQRRPSSARPLKAKTPRRKAAPPAAAAAVPQAADAPRAAARAESAPAKRSAKAAPASDDDGGDLKRAWLAEVQRAKKFFYGTVVAQAQRIVMDGDRITFTFAPNHRTLQTQLEQNRPWLEKTASELAERKIRVVAEQGTADAPAPTPAPDVTTPAPADESLKAEAMDDAAVQAMLDVFPAVIRGVEEV
jgi:DNA polymerase-3 subunit gamma/tau